MQRGRIVQEIPRTPDTARVPLFQRPRDEDAYGEFGHDHLHETPVRKAVSPPIAPA